MPKEPEGLAEGILELRSNSEVRMEFETEADPSNFGMSQAAKAYKTAHLEATKMLLPFAMTYLCEQGISTLATLKTKYRNRFDREDSIQVAAA